jgi:hypothetical protein
MSPSQPSSSPPIPSPSPDSSAAVALDVDLAPDSESHFFVDLSGDASHAGIFVATWRDIPVGRAVVLAASLPDGRIVVSGRVRWLREACCEGGPGIGVALEGLSERDIALLTRFCAECPPYLYEVEAA